MISEYEKEISKAIENDEEMKEEEIRQDMEDAIDQLIHKDLLEVLEVIPTAVESKIPKKFLAEMQNN
jgi:hypothetical protein